MASAFVFVLSAGEHHASIRAKEHDACSLSRTVLSQDGSQLRATKVIGTLPSMLTRVEGTSTFGKSIGNISPLSRGIPARASSPPAVPRASGRLPNPAPGGWPCALLAARRPQDGGDTGPAWGWVTGRSRHHRLLQAAAARRAGCHMGALGAVPDSSAMTRAAHPVFLCAPTIVDTHAHLPHDCSKGTITPDEASNIPLQRSLQFSIVHM